MSWPGWVERRTAAEYSNVLDRQRLRRTSSGPLTCINDRERPRCQSSHRGARPVLGAEIPVGFAQELYLRPANPPIGAARLLPSSPGAIVMNVLINRLIEGFGPTRHGAVRLGLADVIDGLGLRLHVPTSRAEAEAYERAEIPLRQRERWEDLAASFEPLPENVPLHSWTAVVPLPGQEMLAFVPDDDRPDSQILLFSMLGDQRGRLRLSIPGGPGGPVSGVTFEASLHCDDRTCVDDSSCGQCCVGCACRKKSVGLVIQMRCWCPFHGCA